MKKKVLSCLLAAAMVLSFSLPVLAAEEEAAVAEEVAVEAPAEDVVLETAAAEDETDSSSEDANADSTEETTEDAQAADESTTEDAATEEDAASEEEASAEEETAEEEAAVEAEEETPSTTTQDAPLVSTQYIDGSEVGVELILDAPDEVVYGQDYKGVVKVSNKTSKEIKDAVLHVEAFFQKDEIYRVLFQTVLDNFTLGAGEAKDVPFTLNNWDLEYTDQYSWTDLIGTKGTLNAYFASADIDEGAVSTSDGSVYFSKVVKAEQPVTLVSKADGAVDESKSPKTGESSALLWLSAAVLLGGALVIRKGRHAA